MIYLFDFESNDSINNAIKEQDMRDDGSSNENFMLFTIVAMISFAIVQIDGDSGMHSTDIVRFQRYANNRNCLPKTV